VTTPREQEYKDEEVVAIKGTSVLGSRSSVEDGAAVPDGLASAPASPGHKENTMSDEKKTLYQRLGGLRRDHGRGE